MKHLDFKRSQGSSEFFLDGNIEPLECHTPDNETYKSFVTSYSNKSNYNKNISEKTLRYLDESDEDIFPNGKKDLRRKFEELVEDIGELSNYFLEQYGYHYISYTKDKGREKEWSDHLDRWMRQDITDTVFDYTSFHTIRELSETLIAVIVELKKALTWSKRNNKTGYRLFAENFINDIFFACEHQELLFRDSRFRQEHRYAKFANKLPITAEYIDRKLDETRSDIANAESKIGWSTAFYTITISILVSSGFAIPFTGIWYIFAPLITLASLSILLLVSGLLVSGSGKIYEFLEEEKSLFRKRLIDFDKFEWEIEFAKFNKAIIISDYHSQKGKATRESADLIKYLYDSHRSIYYYHFEAMNSIRVNRKSAARKYKYAEWAIIITFGFVKLFTDDHKKYSKKQKAKRIFTDSVEGVSK